MHENRGELLMSIKDLELQRTREDGKTYTTTLGTMHEDAQKQREKVHAKQMRKARRAEMWEKWKPKVLKCLKILGKLAVVGVVLYFSFWIVVGGIALMAVGGGMSGGGRASQNSRNRYNNQNYSQQDPRFWGR